MLEPWKINCLACFSDLWEEKTRTMRLNFWNCYRQCTANGLQTSSKPPVLLLSAHNLKLWLESISSIIVGWQTQLDAPMHSCRSTCCKNTIFVTSKYLTCSHMT